MNNLEDISWEFERVAMYLLITSLCIFHSSFWQNFSNMIISSINYFCSYTIGTLLNIAKLHVSKYLPCLVISQSINSTLSESLIIYLRYKFSECLLTTLLAAFLVVCSILQWKISQSYSFSARLYDKFFYAKPTATFDWMSFWYSGSLGTCFDFLDNLK